MFGRLWREAPTKKCVPTLEHFELVGKQVKLSSKLQVKSWLLAVGLVYVVLDNF